MKATILSVGSEILTGDIINTNAQYLSKKLTELGITVVAQSVVADNDINIKDIIKFSFKSSDLIITTGGLGPTYDDLTKETIAEYFELSLKPDENSLIDIKKKVESYGCEFSENNKKQAYLPEGAIVLKNSLGTAPGCIIEQNQKKVIMLPGPPGEMKPMFEKQVQPYFEKQQNNQIATKIIRLAGIGESDVENQIKPVINKYSNINIATYAKQYECLIKLVSTSQTIEQAENSLKAPLSEINNLLATYIYGYDETTLEAELAKILINKKLTIATAESCTGGMIAAKLINYAGISEVFHEGIITYSNQSKINQLRVDSRTLEQYGAVSEQVAREMVAGLCKKTKTNIGISITGIAGPGGGTADKPVGLVYIGININNNIKVKKLQLSGDRYNIRSITTICALNYLRNELNQQ